jgi:hypothetical protein
MKRILAGLLTTLFSVALGAQTAPLLTELRTPYPPLSSGVRIWGIPYDPNTVSYGPAGTPVTVTGSNLGSSGTVYFPAANHQTVAATVSSWSSTSINVTVPSTAITGVVTVTTGGQTSNPLPFAVMPGSYQTASCSQSLPGPVIASIVPASGPVGTLVTLLGSNFLGAPGRNNLTLNSASVSTAQWTDTVIMFHVPTSAQTGPVVVTTDVGNSNPQTFTVQGASTQTPCN